MTNIEETKKIMEWVRTEDAILWKTVVYPFLLACSNKVTYNVFYRDRYTITQELINHAAINLGKYDESKGVKLSTFVISVMKNQMLNDSRKYSVQNRYAVSMETVAKVYDIPVTPKEYYRVLDNEFVTFFFEWVKENIKTFPKGQRVSVLKLISILEGNSGNITANLLADELNITLKHFYYLISSLYKKMPKIINDYENK